MTAPFFYGSAAELSSVAIGDLLSLSGDEGRHAVTVKRLEVGEQLLIGDGLGTTATATVDQVRGKDHLQAVVASVAKVPASTPQVTVVQALIKGDRMERAVEMMTEAGVDHIVLWQARRSIARASGPARGKLHAKLTNRARQASKQARRAWVPTVSDVVDANELANVVGGSQVCVALNEDAVQSLPDVLTLTADDHREPRDVVLLVGPEGGIDPEEIKTLKGLGLQTASIGPSILRSSTAGTVALGWAMGALGRWSVEH